MSISNLKCIKSDKVKEKNIQAAYQNYISLPNLEQKILLFFLIEAIKDCEALGYSEVGASVISLNEDADLGRNPLESSKDFKEISVAVINLSLDSVKIYGEYWDEVRTFNSSWLSLDVAPFESSEGTISGYVGHLITYYGEDLLKLIVENSVVHLKSNF